MAGPRTCRSLCQNFSLTSKNKLAGVAFTNDNKILTRTPAVSPVPAPPPASAPDVNPTVKYIEADF